MKGVLRVKLIELKCPSCGSNITVDVSGRDSVFCNYCGKQVALHDENKKTFEINKNIRIEKSVHNKITDEAKVINAKANDRENRRLFIMFIIAIAILGIMWLSHVINRNQAISQGKIQAGSYSNYIDIKYEAAAEQLKAIGFTNIKIIDLDDPGFLGGRKGKVKTISIAGKSEFNSDAWFFPDDVVIISHY